MLGTEVSKGQKLDIKAMEWNIVRRWVDQIRARGFGKLDAALKERHTPSCQIDVWNDNDEYPTGDTYPAYGVVGLPNHQIDPADEDVRFQSVKRPVALAALPTATGPFGIVTAPIPGQTVGICVVAGVTVAAVEILDITHGYARPVAGSNVKLQSATSGPVQLISRYDSTSSLEYALVKVVGRNGLESAVVVPASADCSIQINTCPIFKWLKNDAGVLTEYETDPGGGIRVQDGITVEYQGWCGPVTAGSWTGGTATLTSAGHPLVVGDVFSVSGILPAGYNIVGGIVTAISGDTFSYTLADDPGSYLSGGLISAPNITYCVDNPDTCCDSDTTASVGCCTPYSLIVPKTLYVKITNKTGDAAAMPASTLIPGAWSFVTGLPGGASPSLGTGDAILFDQGVGDPFGLVVHLHAGCAYVPDSGTMKPAIQVVIESGSTLTFTPDADYPLKIVTTGALYNVESPTHVYTCTGADITWSPGASDAITHVSVSYDGGLTESAAFDLAIGATP